MEVSVFSVANFLHNPHNISGRVDDNKDDDDYILGQSPCKPKSPESNASDDSIIELLKMLASKKAHEYATACAMAKVCDFSMISCSLTISFSKMLLPKQWPRNHVSTRKKLYKAC